MDKTDMMYGPRDYLRRATLAAPAGSDTTKQRAGVREMNASFGKLEKPRDQKWTSRGAGVAHTPAPANSRRCTWKAGIVAKPLDCEPVMYASVGPRTIRKGSSATPTRAFNHGRA